MKLKLSKKDKSLLLLIVAGFVVLWGIYSALSNIFFTATFRSSDISKLINKDDQWLNVSRPLEIADLKDRIILVDFWTYACVNCIQALPEIKKLEEQFGSKLVVIGVHSGKFSNEKDSSEIKKAILKHDITHPVINDADFRIWNSFKANSWPTFILINPNGRIVKTYFGEYGATKIKKDVKKLISKFKYQLNRDPLPLMPEKYNIIGNVLNFPTKLAYAANFSYKLRQLPVIFIANTSQHNIVVSSLTGDIITKIGSGKEGLEDGSFDAASFNSPQGLLYDSGKLYVADTGNHALRVIDFKEAKVTTLLGSGQRGQIVEDKIVEGKNLDLASPTDIEFFPDKKNIAIANSGTHQILSYSLDKKIVSTLAGNGAEGIDDGKYPDNSLAQTADMSVSGGKLYFVDSESSSLRALDKSGNVKTLIGKGLFDFGHKNGNKSEAQMQHPLGLLVDDTGAYISDSFNHAIRKYNFSSAQISDLVGGKTKGEKLGAKSSAEFDEPAGIISVFDSFYIADSNNNRIVKLSRKNLNSELFDIMPPLQLQKESFLQYLPNLQKIEKAEVKSDVEIILKIDLAEGWKINEEGPSFVNLLQPTKEDQANLIATFDWHSVKNKMMKLPKISAGDYVLQGTIYYCENKKNSLCYIKSYEQNITASNAEKSDQIVVKLAY
jgi:thiol-disulfide isomerase/thioredoxin